MNNEKISLLKELVHKLLYILTVDDTTVTIKFIPTKYYVTLKTKI